MATQKAGNVCSAGSTANLMIAAATMPPAAPSANAMAPTVGQIASRRKQQQHDRGEDDGNDAVRPGGDDPEQLDRADCEERACRIDEQRAANRAR